MKVTADANVLVRAIMGDHETQTPIAQAGLDFVARGGDFADGVIAFEGRSLGADSFLSFDRRAVRLIESGGGSARLLS